jgi:hypothetical protein
MLNRLVLITVLCFGLSLTSAGQTNKADVVLESAGRKALGYFERIEERNFDDYLKRIRPARLSPNLKAQVIASLPEEGEVQPLAAGRTKLAALEPILRFHERSSAIEVKIIRVGHAFIGLHARSVLLISEEALKLLTAEELQAAAAHEMGHEYFWNEYELAREYQQRREMQEIELRCDGIAVITMKHLGLDPSHLISQVTKMTKFNERAGATATANLYTPLDERIKFNQLMIKLINERSRPATHSATPRSDPAAPLSTPAISRR